jgi:hypothetical protein
MFLLHLAFCANKEIVLGQDLDLNYIHLLLNYTFARL